MHLLDEQTNVPAGFEVDRETADLASAVRFACRALLFALPLLASAAAFEGAMYRVGENWPVSAVLARMPETEDGLYHRMVFSQQINLFKVPIVMSRRPEILVLGTSRVHPFRSFMFRPHEASFYNGTGMLQCLDDLVEYEKQVSAGVFPRPRVAIVGVEAQWFSRRYQRERTWLNIWAHQDAAYSFGSHVAAARVAVRHSGEIPWSKLIAGDLAAAPGEPKNTVGLGATVHAYGHRFSDGSHHPGPQLRQPGEHRMGPNSPPPDDDSMMRAYAVGPNGSEVAPEAFDTLVRTLVSLRDGGTEVYVLMPPYCDKAEAQLVRHPVLSKFWGTANREIPPRLAEAGITCLATTYPRDWGLDDSYMQDWCHSGEIFATYLLEALVAKAPPGSHLATLDVANLRALRAVEGADPIAIYPRME